MTEPASDTALSQRLHQLYEGSAKARSPFAMAERWVLSSLIGRDVDANTPATFTEMLPLWVGRAAMVEVEPDRIETYRTFLTEFWSPETFDQRLSETARQEVDGLVTEGDLSALHSLAYLEHLAIGFPKDTPLRILEIGGGYGRLGALAHRYIDRNIFFMSIDAVPESTAYSETYLRAEGLDVQMALAARDMAIRNCNCLIAPAWLADHIAPASFDIVINFSSIQEMPQDTVDAYLTAIPTWIDDGGAFLFANSRDFIARREFDIGAPLYIERKDYTPRSRTLDFPIEVYRKCDTPPDWAQSRIEIAYYIGLKTRALALLDAKAEEVTVLNNLIKDQKERFADTVARHRESRDRHLERVEALKNALKKQSVTIETLRAKIHNQDAGESREGDCR